MTSVPFGDKLELLNNRKEDIVKNNIPRKKKGILISVIFVVLGMFGIQGEQENAGSNTMFLGDNIPHMLFEE